ncbi:MULTISPECIES: DegV family protein [unclassified Solwaraspora]|uniref:DegV family protein n=1 Tax=unclassified Solwaraspora TaxID=2627926 RepID=UPI00259B740C|nr:DegV family protein [Solwaraspora sp. WMMA2056]WJK43353.1 DegV family protein [Solwaraspora sp. WMMA2056]
MPVAVVTDSTAYLPGTLADRPSLTVVPLTVVVDGVAHQEGLDLTPADVARALSVRRPAVSTSRPAPEQFVETYRRLLATDGPQATDDRDGPRTQGGSDGPAGRASAIVSVHLSAELSGTVEAAELAAREVGPDRVAVVDSGSTGMGLGFPALAAAAVAAAGGDLHEVRSAAVETAARTRTLFYVDTLEHLRRGGRITAASALLGTALSVKPILHMQDGRIVLRDKVRTATRALAKLVDLAWAEAGDAVAVDVAVHHLGDPDRATMLLAQLAERLGDRLRDSYVAPIGAVVTAHAGPGLVSIVVHRRAG